LPTAPARRWRPADTDAAASTDQRAPLRSEGALFVAQRNHDRRQIPITSPHNQKLKEIRKLSLRRRERDRSARFVAEGEDLLAAADAAGWTPIERFCATGSGLPGTEVEPELLSAVAGLASGTRALAVYEQRWAPRAAGPLVVYLHGVADPGNVGTVIRSAHAFGAACVAFGPDTADPFSPRCVRASMGSIFAVALSRCSSPAELPGVTVALDPDAAREPLSDTIGALRAGASGLELSLLIGAERAGLPDDVLRHADRVARIPIATHSLNAAMAATVALYEATQALADGSVSSAYSRGTPGEPTGGLSPQNRMAAP
jgi:TrmH family RNA methyltransferase